MRAVTVCFITNFRIYVFTIVKAKNVGPIDSRTVINLIYSNNRITDGVVAVEEIFKVNVVSVNIVNVRRKARRVGKYEGFRPAVKKAVVTVAEGQTIDAFEI